MQILYKLILISHIAAGFVALTLFWVQAATKKGSARHRTLGNLYVKLMWVVVFSAVFLCIFSFINGRNVIAIFLLFIALITAKPLWLGIAILRARNTLNLAQVRVYRINGVIFNLAVCLMGASMVGYGIYLNGEGFAVLLMIFGGLGMLSVFDLWSSVVSLDSTDFSKWMKAHIVGMGTSGIAAHTAFLVFGANRFMPQELTQSYWSIVPWVLPTLIGLILMRLAVNKYQPKMSNSSV